MGDYLYTVAEAAKTLKVNKNSIYDLIRCGYLKVIKFRVTKIPSKEIEAFIDKYTGYDLSDLSNPTEI